MNTVTSTRIALLAGAAALVAGFPATAEVEYLGGNALNKIVYVTGEAWHPEGFVEGTTVPALWEANPRIRIDGIDDEAAWAVAEEIEVALAYGNVERAWVKAFYTDKEVYIRVRWPDPTEDREHHAWTWDAAAQRWVASPRGEDSVMLSFEAGCEWTPSLLSGYIYDFDAWRWHAARSDPLGQAVDLYGNVQGLDRGIPDFEHYQSRVTESYWEVKFTENHFMDMHASWDELDRAYLFQPVSEEVWVRAVPDGGYQKPPFFEQLPPPLAPPAEPGEQRPQYRPLPLPGSAGEVAARGRWEDGYWTVEFRRARHTPVQHIYDTIFNRTVQFSVLVFDAAERLDESSESGRLFLQLIRPQHVLADK